MSNAQETTLPTHTLYVDSSGDTGFRFGEGSTSHLTLVFVHIEDYEEFRRRVQRHRQDRSLPRDYEFHWARNSPTERTAYLETIRSQRFRAWALLVNKPTLPRHFRTYNQYELYGVLARSLARRIPREVIEEARLVIDDRDKKTPLTVAFRGAISAELRLLGYDGGIRARGCPAHREEGLQLADMLAGAVSAAKEHGGADCLFALRDRIEVVRFEPVSGG